MPFTSTNPSTNLTTHTFPTLTPAELEAKLALASATFPTFRQTPANQRAQTLLRSADLLLAETPHLAALITAEMGKPLRAAAAEVAKCATACRYYAQHGPALLADEPIPTAASQSFVRYQPLGTILAIMPWNFPFWQVFRFAAPTLMAGNTILLKHAPNVPQCALAIEDIFLRAGFLPGAFLNLFIEVPQIEPLLDDPRIAAATLTGSEPAGRAVAIQAATRIKKVVLELGGSDPFIVLPSAPLDRAIATAVSARTLNSGQSCIAAKRFIVHQAIYSEFESRFTAAMQALTTGDPLLDSTDLGPLSTPAIRAALHRQVLRAIQDGAQLLTGGTLPEGPGNFYPPTVLAHLPRTSPVSREELFGPVALLFRAEDAAQALEIANDTPFGLGSSVWTTDPAEQQFFTTGIEAGQVFVNAPTASDTRLPFGGIKRSGYGRELGPHGIREFVNIKTIVVYD